MVEVFFLESNEKKVEEREREILIIIKNDFQSAIQNGFICHDLLQGKNYSAQKTRKNERRGGKNLQKFLIFHCRNC